MSKPDIIMQWCIYCDYPLYREWLNKYRDKFDKVILYPSRQHGHIDLEKFVQEELKETWVNGHTIDWTTPGIDWRQAETEPCLERSEAEWIWFQEADFFCKDWDKLFTDIEKAIETSDMIGLWSPSHFPYIHPSCLLIKRELLDKTNKDFRAHPEIDGSDHFAMITKDAIDLGAKITTLQDMGYNCSMSPDADCFHLGGLTYVYQDWHGGTEEDHIGSRSPEAFMVYNYMMKLAEVEIDRRFVDLSWEIHDFFVSRFPKLDFENNPWRRFFKAE